MRWLLVLLACAGCKRQADAPPPPGPESPAAPVMPASEVRRGQDACKAYVDQVCACADPVPAMKQPCALARALPEAMQVGLDVATNPESSRRDVLQAEASVRKIAKECIEQITRLPAAGCP